MSIQIDGIDIGSGHPPYVIAELSANHNGSLELALASIDAAAKAGAQAVKIQTYTADTMTIDSDKADFSIEGGLWDGYTLYELYKQAHTPYEWHEKLFAYAKKIGITLFSSPFDESAVDLLESLETPAYKIASFELVDIPLIRYVASKRKPVIMSTGMASLDEIGEAVGAARAEGCQNIILLHCVSSYPAPTDQSHLKMVVELSKYFKVDVGLSDHTMTHTASVASVALGACLVEKHFTLDRKNDGPDSQFSLEPNELEGLIGQVNEAWRALGDEQFVRPEAEMGSSKFRRSIYFVKDLAAGHRIEFNDIKRIRPGMGLPPKYFDSLIGKTLARDVERGDPTSWDSFE